MVQATSIASQTLNPMLYCDFSMKLLTLHSSVVKLFMPWKEGAGKGKSRSTKVAGT
jgi:hypothetical protein